MNQHTPGPWIIDDKAHDKFGQRVWVQAEHGNYICELVRDGKFREHANARLIAAAPELLEVCEMLIEADGDMLEHVIVLAGEAVAKAKGEVA